LKEGVIVVLRKICTIPFLFAAPLFASDGVENKPSDDIAARELVKTAAAALKDVQRVTYKAEYDATNWIKTFVPRVTGEVILGQEREYELVEFSCDVTVRGRESAEESRFRAGCDGDQFFLIDPETRTMHRDMDQAVLGSNSRSIQRVVLEDFSSSEPLKELIEAEIVESRGTHTVDGHLCRRVYVKTKEGQEQVWSFSEIDHLPRHVERMWKNQQEEPGSTLLTLTHLNVNPRLEGQAFNPAVPEGYTKTDEFAP